MNITKISQNMKNKALFSIEKKHYRVRKNESYKNYFYIINIIFKNNDFLMKNINLLQKANLNENLL